MDVKTVCLGMLTRGPATGYDLKKYFESTFGHFFAAGFGSIYPALNSLASDGHVECEEVPQDGKPDRKVYTITESGRGLLAEALDNPAPSHKLRSEFLATLFFAHLMDGEQIDRILDNRLKEIDEFLAALDAMDMSDLESWPAGTRFVAGFGRNMALSSKRYIEEYRHLLADDVGTELQTAIG